MALRSAFICTYSKDIEKEFSAFDQAVPDDTQKSRPLFRIQSAVVTIDKCDEIELAPGAELEVVPLNVFDVGVVSSRLVPCIVY